MYIIRIVISIVALILISHPAHAKVTLQGLSKGLESQLRKKYPQSFRGRARLADIDGMLRIIMASGKYEGVEAERTKSGHVVIKANSIKVIKKVTIAGNSISSEFELKRLINIKSGEKFNKQKILTAGEELKKFYGERGHFSAVIEVRFLKIESGGLEIFFDIKENDPCLIEKFNLISANKELNERVQRRLNRRLKKKFTQDLLAQIRSDLNEYLVDKRYLKAQLVESDASYNGDKTRVQLTYQIRDPLRYEILINGNSSLTTSSIFRAMDLDNFDSTILNPGSELADRIRKRYLRDGYPNIKVAYDEKDVEKTLVKRLSFDIDEGQRVRIDKIEVTGRFSRNADYYAEFIEDNSSDLISDGYYNRLDIENGYNNLVVALQNQGYLRAKVQSARIEYLNKERSLAKVIVILDEGPLTQIRKIQFRGAKAFSERVLSQQITLKVNSPLRLNELDGALKDIQDFYRNNGYLEMKILNLNKKLVKYNETGTQADIIFLIQEGPKVVVSSIIIDGNTFTKDFVILREIDIEIGDTLTPTNIQESIDRLNKLGIFNRADIRTVEEGSNVSQRTLLVQISERDPGVFKVGMGANSERKLTARGFTGVSYNNIAGTARGVSSRVEGRYNIPETKYFEHKIIAGYLEPFIFGTRTRGRVNLTREQQVIDFDTESDELSIGESNRLDFLLERDLTSSTKLTWRLWSIETRRTFERNDKFEEEEIQIATIGPSLDVDLRDDPFLPTRGHHIKWNLDYSDPVLASSDTVHFVRTEASYTYLWNFDWKGFIWANNLRGGYLANISDRSDSGVPRSYSFILGGTSTVRGFGGTRTSERLPPIDFTEDNENAFVPHDSHYYLIKSELRFPLSSDNSLGGVIFYDGGLVYITGRRSQIPKLYRQAVGFGFRYNTPVGPVSLDMGWKLDRIPEAGEDEFRVHFSIGTF